MYEFFVDMCAANFVDRIELRITLPIFVWKKSLHARIVAYVGTYVVYPRSVRIDYKEILDECNDTAHLVFALSTSFE